MAGRRALTIVAFLVAACAPNAVGSPPRGEASPTPRTLGGVPLERCTNGSTQAERTLPSLCGTLTVPEDPAAPDGRTIDLRVVVIPAAGPAPEPDPVFMLAGGPGGSAVDSLAWTATAFGGIHDTRDIVLVDQRGTGRSNEVLLDPLPDLLALPEAERESAAQAWIDGQLAGVDADPAFYTTSVAMDDLDAVRASLGYDRINLWGGSYGATAAQYYLRQHGDRVRAVVLDGGTLLDVPVFERIARNSQAALDSVFERCTADPDCAAAYPDLRTDFDAVLARLEAGPVSVDITDPETGEPGRIDRTDFTAAIHGALLSADLSAMVPWFISAAADDRWEEAIVAAHSVGGSDPRSTAYPLMSAVIRCSEAWAVYDPAEVTRTGAGSYYLDAQVEQAQLQETLCDAAPRGVVPSDDAAPAAGDMPVLFVVGSADPQDPPANIAEAAGAFPDSLTVVAAGHGHTVTHLGCLPSVVDAFIAAGSTTGLDTACVAGGVPLPPFRLP